jgi:hypothetical protein
MPDLNADRRDTNKVQTAERNGGVHFLVAATRLISAKSLLKWRQPPPSYVRTTAAEVIQYSRPIFTNIPVSQELLGGSQASPLGQDGIPLPDRPPLRSWGRQGAQGANSERLPPSDRTRHGFWRPVLRWGAQMTVWSSQRVGTRPGTPKSTCAPGSAP